MKVLVTKSFKWASDGNNTRTVVVGEVLDGRGAAVAISMGCGKELKAEGAPTVHHIEDPVEKLVEEVPAEKAVAAPPENAAIRKAPRNKGR